MFHELERSRTVMASKQVEERRPLGLGPRTRFRAFECKRHFAECIMRNSVARRGM
jgi:hypothetical protein